MTKSRPTILVINPGSTSTRVALFSGRKIAASETLEHEPDELHAHKDIMGQLDTRKKAVALFLKKNASLNNLGAIAGRGGLLRPLRGGTYPVNQQMLEDLTSAKYGEHASNLGAVLAKYFADQYQVPAFVVDPVTMDEFDEASRLSGFPGIPRKSRIHALNIRAVTRRFAAETGSRIKDLNLVVAHLGGGISVCAIKGGRIMDSTDALLGEGPFSLERAGTLPLSGMIELCFNQDYSKEKVIELLSRHGGFMGYYRIDRLPDIYRLIDGGNREAEVLLEAMVRQVAKWIGAMAVLLKKKPDAIILTGGMIHSERLLGEITTFINHLGDIKAYPGELEMEALAEGVLRVIEGEEQALEY